MDVKNQQEQQQKRPLLKCPRCESTNTKFCYYNNHSKLQPRHFCRACKRHWTEGGMLRKVPVGGCRRNKRARTSSSDNNDCSSNQQQQGAVAAPLSGEIDTAAIFPDIFLQLLFQPQPPQSLLPSSQLLPAIGGSESFLSGFCSSNSSSSLCGLKGKELVSSSEENMLLNLVDGYNNNGGSWLQDSLPQPANSFWNCWDGMIEFDASEIKLSTPTDQSL